MTRNEYLINLSEKKVLLLDGAMGTLIQQQNLDNEDFSTSMLNGIEREFPGFGELLNISRPDVIFDIHSEFLASGADIITTNTFCANKITLSEYNLQNYVKELNQSAVEIARAAAEIYEAENESKFVFVAGSIGPTGKMLSFSTDSEDVSKREYIFNDFKEAYKEQAIILLETRCDILLIETVFDTLVCKAALEGIREAQELTAIIKPIMVSVTFSDISGHTLSGQSLEAFCTSLSTYPIFSLGMNCSMGAKEMIPLIEKLSKISPFRVSAHPNAGLPLLDGTYAQSSKVMAQLLFPILKKGLVNIIGGCCGTTASHIKALNNQLNSKDTFGNLICTPKKIVNKNNNTFALCGLEREEKADRLMIVGERCNVAGSRKFATLIEAESWEEAAAIARSQAESKADVIDICMDSSMIDGPIAMTTFLRYINCDPAISKKPYMIDSSSWDTIVSALGEIQGRCIVNSISLKEGEAKFISQAKTINNYGHAMVVMLFDEMGQADTYKRKIEIAKRSYNILVSNGIRKDSIIFDPNILSVATGIEESDGYALAFIQAVKWIKDNLEGANVCGGVSNLSFSFRGNNAIRRAMHTVFLHYARKAGLDFAIIAPNINLDINQIPVDARNIIEKALLEPSPINSENLIELASSNILGNSVIKRKSIILNPKNEADPKKRVQRAILNGETLNLEEDVNILLSNTKKEGESPVSIVEGPFMAAMALVGEKFSKGEMFLPQVVKSARTMKSAVSYLQPAIEAWKKDNTDDKASKPSEKVVVFATVKGDVHDIGKNICILILRCNGFKVIDLGVMVPTEKIIKAAIENNADLICLSALITPSLQQMANVCTLAVENNLKTPILVGGATTSEEHTALKLSPLYNYRVFYGSNASDLSTLAMEIVRGGELKISELSTYYKNKQQTVKQNLLNKKKSKNVAYKTALENRFIKQKASIKPPKIGITILDNEDIDNLIQLINWKMFAFSYGIPPHGDDYLELVNDAKNFLKDPQVNEVLSKSLRGVYGIFPCTSDSLTINVSDSEKFTFCRQEKDDQSLSLADYCCNDDFIAMYIVTAGLKVNQASNLFDEGDFLMLNLLAARLAEAFSQRMEILLKEEWGAPLLTVAPGYPSCPNHYHKKGIFNLLDGEKNSQVQLTENFMMSPEASIASFAFQGKGLKYFNVGKIGKTQLKKISECQNLSEKQLLGFGIQLKQEN